MFAFITKKPLWANILFAIALIAALLFLFLLSLNWITHHGKKISIPAVIGKSFPDAKAVLEKQGFEVNIQDSVYVDSLPPLAVVKQFPEADAEVKINRPVYLTINRAKPPLVDMPQLIGLTLHMAIVQLKQAGLKLGDTSYVPDFARNTIKKQMYNGEDVAIGSKVPLGAKIDLAISSGVSNEDLAVPNLIGMTYNDAKILLEASGLESVMSKDPDVTDSANAFVNRQSPARFDEDHRINRIHPGQLITINLGVNKPVTDSTAPNNPPPPPNPQ